MPVVQSEVPGSSRTIHLEFSSSFEMLQLVDGVTEQFGHMAGLDPESVHRVSVAVREAVVNAVKHGNRQDPRKHVRVTFEVVARPAARLVICVRDEGEGFDPGAIPDPCEPDNIVGTGGRGVFLIRHFMDDVQVREAPGGGTEIVMAKSINGAPPQH
jgi:serine/threonine-protein kinase RsbW